MEEKTRKSTDAQIRASLKYKKEKCSRIPLDVSKQYHLYLKEITKEAGTSVNTFIKEAIAEKIERDGLRQFEEMSSPD